ncbi:MAG: glycosyltransferase family 9 protein [Pseudohongiella sp.]|uniref:glycosyltransferase family 9 protein n=1 Tax=Pseudohongiella sp. TaxID=1979412 RepID=UPI0034A09716
MPGRIALINPTKFLGNLLLAGGLMQSLCRSCQQQGVELLIVLDESFRDLFAGALPGARLVYYPRRALSRGFTLTGARRWLECVSQIRAFAADLAFTIEEDSVCHRLTHLSGARRKVSSTVHRYHFGFDQVLDIPRSGRTPGEGSIWYSFRDVFAALKLPVDANKSGEPGYVRLSPPAPDPQLLARLTLSGFTATGRVAVLHAGASKNYKKWPEQHFVALGSALIQQGYEVVLIGAGALDAEVNQRITQALANSAQVCVDLCNKVSLAELASLLGLVDIIIGNDSGPSHLASALGVRGVVIFGPTDLAIWGPLGGQTTALQHKQACAPDCSRHHCDRRYACLDSITPQQVLAVLALQTTATHIDAQTDRHTDRIKK